ncbi:polyprenyl synthetase family protein [Roseibacillus ishigakijimensis]|uniref:Polyprenyl synthetase family protein n=1 Tax=Roseibacillus ishigakijimensis TaxID=454146 RepID=A0A934VNA7_9BACT|nr:polyprenyl synthetase family protein [Roseibacillus ishigakijimensis]MBK1834916.1 polyprenyl synthetase family protein [Roseibacillus ishigakijimensis]
MNRKLQLPGRANLLAPFDLVRPHLKKVESLLNEQVKAFDPGVAPYVDYVCNASGKRLRPALAVLTGGALGPVTDDHRKLGSILELIHVASLVHDDIIDGADIRRKLATPNAKWGDGLAVLLGDALFSHALMMSTEFDDLHLSREIAKAAREVCQGEILQTQRRFDLTMSRQEYFRLLEMKTGALFAAATGLSAYLSGADKETQEDLYQFGLKLGTAYQLYDDCLDLVGEEEEFGKTLRTDLEKGKLTLPILRLLEKANPAQREKLQQRIINQEPLDLSILSGIADYEGAIDYSIETAIKLLGDARDPLHFLPDNQYRAALFTLADYLLDLLQKLR